MDKKLPRRPREHDIEELSERFFRNCLPENWVANKPPNDYGTDLIVNIFDDGHTSPYELHIQLKSTENPTPGDNEKITLKVASYNYLMDALPVTMLVQYVVPEKEAYWILLVDVDEPNQEQESFTVYLPKINKLSAINWKTDIEDYVREVVDYKLASAEAIRQNRKNPNKID